MQWARKAIILLNLAITLLAAPGAKAGAWAKEPGHGLAILTSYFYSTDEQFGNGWHKEPFGYEGRFVKNEWNLYTEYGICKRLTFVGNFFLDALTYENRFERQNNFGLADQEVGLRYQFADKIPQSLQLTVKIPGPYSVNTQPALGNGQTDVELAYYIGSSYKVFDHWGFVDAGAGFRLRTGAPADELRWYLTAGMTLTKWLEIYYIEASGIHGLGDDQPQFVGNNILLTTDFDLIKLGGSLLIHPAKNWTIQAGPYFSVAGRATGAGGGFKLAVWREF